jgi:hypothetical protein
VRNPYAGKPTHQFWRRSVSGRGAEQVDPVVKRTVRNLPHRSGCNRRKLLCATHRPPSEGYRIQLFRSGRSSGADRLRGRELRYVFGAIW